MPSGILALKGAWLLSILQAAAPAGQVGGRHPSTNSVSGSFPLVRLRPSPWGTHQSEVDASVSEIPFSLNFHWHSYCFLQMFWCWHIVLLKNSCPALLSIPSSSKLSARFGLPGLWQSHNKETCNMNR